VNERGGYWTLVDSEMKTSPGRLRPSAGLSKTSARARQRLLEAAGKIFAEKGYSRGTSREICKRARMNVAAVNYHFGSIDALYGETLLLADRRMSWIGLLDEIVSSRASASQKLGALLTAILKWITIPGANSWELRLLAREIVEPSPAHEQFASTAALSACRIARQIAADLIGAHPTDAVVGRTILTSMAPCLVLCLGSRAMLMTILPALADPGVEAGPLVEHSARFICAGIEATARHYAATNGPASRKAHNRE
jgi:TetR/AcrR family transcriptional regulator, regulator of cefoperazone and chloramphenicol sensitivity